MTGSIKIGILMRNWVDEPAFVGLYLEDQSIMNLERIGYLADSYLRPLKKVIDVLRLTAYSYLYDRLLLRVGVAFPPTILLGEMRVFLLSLVSPFQETKRQKRG